MAHRTTKPTELNAHSSENTTALEKQSGLSIWCGALVLKVCEIRSESLIRFVAMKFAIPSNCLEAVRSNPLVKLLCEPRCCKSQDNRLRRKGCLFRLVVDNCERRILLECTPHLETRSLPRP